MFLRHVTQRRDDLKRRVRIITHALARPLLSTFLVTLRPCRVLLSRQTGPSLVVSGERESADTVQNSGSGPGAGVDTLASPASFSPTCLVAAAPFPCLYV